MRSTTHVILFAVIMATVLISLDSIQGNITDSGYIFWMGLIGGCLALGAQTVQLINEIKEDLLEAEEKQYQQQTQHEGR